MNIMKIDSYKAKIEYDSEIDMFRGEILGLNGGADFYGKNPNELRREFKKSLSIFLEICAEKSIYDEWTDILMVDYPSRQDFLNRVSNAPEGNIQIRDNCIERALMTPSTYINN